MSNAFKTPAKLFWADTATPWSVCRIRFVLPVNALSSMEVALLSIAGSTLFYQVKTIRLNCAILTAFSKQWYLAFFKTLYVDDKNCCAAHINRYG